MPPAAAVIGGIGSIFGGAAAGAAGLAAGAASAIGAIGSGLLSAAGGLASGVGGLLFGGQAAVPVMIGGEMGSLAAASATTGGVGLFPAVAGITGQLAEILPTAMGIYQQISPAEVKAPAPIGALPFAPSPTIAKTGLPIFSQQPATMTVGAVAKPEPNYILYIGLAILVLFLLRKK